MRGLENTPENKAKFFAQYLGHVFINGNGGTSLLCPIDLQYIKSGIIGATLFLKPLSGILLKDAEFIVKSESVNSSWGAGDSASKVFLYYRFSNSIKTKTLDYVRSEGYAIDWMGLSVEKLIEYGWIQLKKEGEYG